MGTAVTNSCWQRNWRVAFVRSWQAQMCAGLLLVFAMCVFYINFTLNRVKEVDTQTTPMRKINSKFSGDEIVKFHTGDKQIGQTNRALSRYIQSLLVGPSHLDYNLTQPDKEDYSEIGQSRFVDKLLNGRENGFFFEAGAHNGESFSNSLFFEKSRGWQGLLVEPNPYTYQDLLLKRRKVHSLNACVSPTNRASILTFQPAGLEGGLLNKLSSKQRESLKEHPEFRGKLLDVQCFPFYSIILATSVKHIDLVALDVIGAELDVIRFLPLDQVQIDVFQIAYRVYKPGGDEIDETATKQKLDTLRNFFQKSDLYEEAGIMPKVTEGQGQDVFFKRKEIAS